jgi:hypothetical protein
MFGEVRTVFRVMAPPRAIVVVEMMVWIYGVDPQHKFRRAHDVFLFSASGLNLCFA